MEPLSVNYLAIITGTVLSMILGFVWYGPLFGKKWKELAGANDKELKDREKMQQSMTPLLVGQFVITLFQVLVLAHLIADTTRVGGLERSLWIWAAFVLPTLFATIMWTAESGKRKKGRLLIQGSYQFVIFAIFGLLLQFWK